MVIYFGADHRGFELKEHLKTFVHNQGYEVADMGAVQYDEKDDYPDFAGAVGKKVSLAPDQSRGIVICRSGAGVDITANKFKNVRAVLGFSPDQIYDARHDDDANVLAIAAGFVTKEEAEKFAQVFIATPFANTEERFARRLKKIAAIEEQGNKSN